MLRCLFGHGQLGALLVHSRTEYPKGTVDDIYTLRFCWRCMKIINWYDIRQLAPGESDD